MVVFAIEVDKAIQEWSGFLQFVGAMLAIWFVERSARRSWCNEQKRVATVERREHDKMQEHLTALYSMVNHVADIVETQVLKAKDPVDGVEKLAMDATGSISLTVLTDELFRLDVALLPKADEIGRMLRLRGSFRVIKEILDTIRTSLFLPESAPEKAPDFYNAVFQIRAAMANIRNEVDAYRHEHFGRAVTSEAV
jgi:hypothetical protein